MKYFDYKKAFTHGGIFHSDDVFSSAFLKILNPDIIIERGNEVPDDYKGIVFDIGFGKYDHHQKDKREREDETLYAAFGLLWEEFGELVLGKEDAKRFDEDFVKPLDNSDNTGEKNTLALIISDFIPAWNENEKDMDTCFFEAVEFAKGILERKFKIIKSKNEATQNVKKMIENNKGPILYFEKTMPWKEAAKNTDLIYVIFPSIRGGYIVQAVPSDDEGVDNKYPFPDEWCGETKDKLYELTGIETFSFCHNSGFLAATDTKEDAYKVAELSMKKYGLEN